MTISTRRLRRRAAALAASLAVVTVAAGCSGGPPQRAGETSDAPSSVAGSPRPSLQPSIKPPAKPSALEAARTAVEESLQKLARSSPKPNRNQMRVAYKEAGLSPLKTEVSIDITPTGLPVDAIQAAAPVGRTCVVGEVRDGKVTVVSLPVLASGRCFVGDDR